MSQQLGYTVREWAIWVWKVCGPQVRERVFPGTTQQNVNDLADPGQGGSGRGLLGFLTQKLDRHFGPTHTERQQEAEEKYRKIGRTAGEDLEDWTVRWKVALEELNVVRYRTMTEPEFNAEWWSKVSLPGYVRDKLRDYGLYDQHQRLAKMYPWIIGKVNELYPDLLDRERLAKQSSSSQSLSLIHI